MRRQLKAYAFNKHADQNNRGLRQSIPKLIYVHGDPESFIALGKFLTKCGRQMRRAGPFHRHFRDYLRGWSSEMIDVVAERPLADKRRKMAANKPAEGTR